MRRTVLLLTLPLLLALPGCAFFGPQHYAVFYAPQSSVLDAQGQKVVATVAQRALARPDAPVVVNGYADPEGTAADNRQLAARRSRAVADALVADGVDPHRIQRHSIGGVDYTLDSIESRRVEITIGGN